MGTDPVHGIPLVVGLGWREANAAVRDACWIPPDREGVFLEALLALPGVEEAAFLSTCNRLEVVLASDPATDPVPAVLDVWAGFGRPPSGWIERLHVLRGQDAVRHLLRVASSIDSLVLGETQITGQLCEAFSRARSAHGRPELLSRLHEAARLTARRVRNRTGLGQGRVSVASAMVDLALHVMGVPQRLVVGVVGAGEMARLAVEHFQERGVRQFLVVNRDRGRGRDLALSCGGEAHDFDALGRVLPDADVWISSTSAPGFVIGFDDVRRAMTHRRFPIFLLDIATPRDIDPAVSTIDDVYLYDIDDLQRTASEGLERRRAQAAAAEAVVEEEISAFSSRARVQCLSPVLEAVRTHGEDVALREVARFQARLRRAALMGPKALDEVALALARGVAAKILHRPLMALRSSASRGDGKWAENCTREFLLPDANDREGGST